MTLSKQKLLLYYTLVYLFLFVTCYLPWVYNPDIASEFTGFYSYHNVYGKPALLLLTVGFMNGLILPISRIWARFLSLGLMSLFLAYGIRTFYLYSSCHGMVCPVVKIGLWLMIGCVMCLFYLSLLGKVKKRKP